MPVRVSPVLIGRDDLVALIGRRLDEAADRRGQLLLLAGEAGIGKTRLLGEARRLAVARGFAVVDGAAYPRDAEVAGGMLLDLAADLTRRGGPDGDALARRLRDAGAETDSHRRRRLLVGDLADRLSRL